MSFGTYERVRPQIVLCTFLGYSLEILPLLLLSTWEKVMMTLAEMRAIANYVIDESWP